MSLIRRRKVRGNVETLEKLRERRNELSKASARFQTDVMNGTYKSTSRRVRVVSSEEKDTALS